MKRSTLLPLTALCLSALACDLGKPGNLGELTDATTDASTSGADATGNPTTGNDTIADTEVADSGSTGDPGPVSALDILFVIDNSGSMATSQQRIAEAIDEFAAPLMAASLDVRIAVTTTDAGNPRCPGTTPEKGALQTTSCRARVQDGEFVSNDVDFSLACLDACQHDTIEILPTVTTDDPFPAPRPWVEWRPGSGNLEIPLAEALACMLPQGVAGCGFESQLESLYRAIAHMQDDDDPAAGFLRPDAHFVAIVVTDETDCSYNPEFEDIFTTNKTFWFDPDNDVAPSSSMCWKAGMACEGGPGTYDGCAAADFDNTGAATSDLEAAVLYPLGKYDAILDAVKATKVADAQVQVIVIGGVPAGYPQNPLIYSDSDDPAYQSLFGIGPGCEHMGVTAAPPGRMLEVAEQHAPLVQSIYSICQTSLAGPLSAIGAGLVNN